jgi:hypothetical protein
MLQRHPPRASCCPGRGMSRKDFQKKRIRLERIACAAREDKGDFCRR